jgi:NAD(P)-dependent dehydrogenase (short-subunit alcohol dehydrogenase family)
MGRMQDKTAVITGGTSGIGRAAAELFVAEGARVLIVGRHEAQLQALQSALGADRLMTYAADLRDGRQVAAYTRLALESFGRIDAVLLNAGVAGINTPLEDYPEDLFDEVLAINLKAVWLGLRAVVPAMKAQGGGSIVVTSSIQGLSAVAGTTAYTASKHALVGMMKGAAVELAPYKIRVNTVHPGYVEGPMMDEIARGANPEAPEAFHAAIWPTIPMHRYGRPEEVAQLMLFLASDESSYSTGGCFTADGGILATLP